MKVLLRLLLASCLGCACHAAANSEWTLVRSSHFDVYSQAGELEGRSIALWLEQLQSFFANAVPLQEANAPATRNRVRAIEFRSASEYSEFQPRPAADAFFIGAEAADYIVMPRFGVQELQITAHEYAHLVLHSLGVRLQPWFAEGLAEVFSTVRFSKGGYVLGGDLPGRSRVLRQRPWIPLPQLLQLTEDAPVRVHREEAEVFYAESWALADMLVFSQTYAPHFGQFWQAMASGAADSRAIAQIYGKPLSAVLADLKVWVCTSRSGVAFPPTPGVHPELEVFPVKSFEIRRVMADLLLACGELERAQAAFEALAKERPDDAAVYAALGSIALRKEDLAAAREPWRRAVALGITDPDLCYRYAVLADDAGVPNDEVLSALKRAVELRPDFDDARFRLGLLLANTGNYEAALENLGGMRSVPAGRAYAYWTAMATALTETDQRNAAKDAAHQALLHASNPEERASALSLAYVAETDLTVQFARDAHGNLQMVTARKPHGANNWNPFIEPGDHMRSFSGQIHKVECTNGKISGFQIRGNSAQVEVTLPDPAHVMIAGGSAEFVCDAEDGRTVAIEYAVFEKEAGADGILRGMQFQ